VLVGYYGGQGTNFIPSCVPEEAYQIPQYITVGANTDDRVTVCKNAVGLPHIQDYNAKRGTYRFAETIAALS
jgi:hypothetical protein